MAAATFGEISGSHPFFFLATWSPAIAAFVVVFMHSGTTGIRAFLSRLLLWRCSAGWAAFILLFLPLVFVAGSLIKGGPVLAPLPPEGVGPVVAVLFMMLMLGPVEEFGWRGVMQPLLQRHMAPIWAGLIIGATWGFWHLPAFFLSSTVYADWNFLPFFIGNVTLAVLVTPIFNSTRGSLLWPMLFHWQLINPFWPDAQPWDTMDPRRRGRHRRVVEPRHDVHPRGSGDRGRAGKPPLRSQGRGVEYARDLMAAGMIAGFGCRGLADVEAGRAMTPETPMLAASIGKTFVAAAVLALESEGRLSRADLLADHLGDRPWFGDLPNAQFITVAHLLHHSAGLPDHVHLPAFQSAWARMATGDATTSPEDS
jgi:uncharacterized protein